MVGEEGTRLGDRLIAAGRVSSTLRELCFACTDGSDGQYDDHSLGVTPFVPALLDIFGVLLLVNEEGKRRRQKRGEEVTLTTGPAMIESTQEVST